MSDGTYNLNGSFRPTMKKRAAQSQCGGQDQVGGAGKSVPVTGRRRCRMHGGADGTGAPGDTLTATRRWIRDAIPRRLNSVRTKVFQHGAPDCWQRRMIKQVARREAALMNKAIICRELLIANRPRHRQAQTGDSICR
jgi:hypothetical protein